MFLNSAPLKSIGSGNVAHSIKSKVSQGVPQRTTGPKLNSVVQIPSTNNQSRPNESMQAYTESYAASVYVGLTAFLNFSVIHSLMYSLILG